jgi:hypothetical protein
VVLTVPHKVVPKVALDSALTVLPRAKLALAHTVLLLLEPEPASLVASLVAWSAAFSVVVLALTAALEPVRTQVRVQVHPSRPMRTFSLPSASQRASKRSFLPSAPA